jgi:hypothetical protein
MEYAQMSDLDLTRADIAQEFQFITETTCLLEGAKGKLSESEIIKNTQAYLSGKRDTKGNEEYKPYISQSDAIKDEMRRRQIFTTTPSYSTQESFQHAPSHNAPLEHMEHIESGSEPGYTFREGVHDTLSTLGSLADAATPFLMWDVAKEHARNGNGIYRRASHYDDYYGPGPQFYNPNQFYSGQRFYNPNQFYPGQRNFRQYNNFGPQNSDSEFSHGGPDGLTFSRSRQRVPRGGYNDYPRGGYNDYHRGGYNDYRSNGLHDTIDALGALSGIALPFLQWDIAKQHARNQRDRYNYQYDRRYRR